MVHIIGQKLSNQQVAELVDILRRNFMYQSPKPRPENPDQCSLFMIGNDWMRMLELCQEHGGWELPSDAVKALTEKTKRNGNSVDESDAAE